MPRQRIVNVNVVRRLSSVGVFGDEAHISAQTVIPQHTTTPEYPEGFPTPPPEYRLMFKSWANAWWKDHPGQPAPNWLCDLLDKFTSLLAPPSKVEVDAAHSRLATAESRVSVIELRLAYLDRLINHSYQQSLEGTGINNNEIVEEAGRKIKETWVTYDRAKVDLNEARQSARLAKTGFQEAHAEFRKAKSIYDAETTRIFTKCEIDDRLGITSNTDSTYKPTLRINGALWTSEGSTPSLSRTELLHDHLDIYVDLRVQRRVRVFQEEIVHHPTRRLPSHLKFMDTSHIGHDVDLRYLPSEHGIVGYFCADIVPVVREILKVSRPGAELLTIVGNPTNQADMFFQVRVKNAAGQWVYSSVPVEFKRPYSYDKKPAAGLTQSPEWAMEAEMPTPEFGQRVVMQLYGYMSEGSYGAPSVVVGTINPRFGFFSTYNDTWFLELPPKDGGGPLRAEAKPLTAVPDNATCANSVPAGPTSNHIRIVISPRFPVANAEPHIAFVYAFVLDAVIEDMVQSKGGYAHVPLEAHVAGSAGEARGHGKPKKLRLSQGGNTTQGNTYGRQSLDMFVNNTTPE